MSPSVDSAPVFTSASSATAVAGTAFSFTVTATGFPLPTLAATGLPGWLTLTKNGNGSATIAGTPTKGGVYNVTITATNTAGKTPQAFTLTVNQAAAVTSPAKATATVGNPFNVLVTATGYPGPAIAVTGLPAGLVPVDNGDGTATMAGMPAADTGGVHDVTITATNGVKVATQTFVLTVDEGPSFANASSATAVAGTAFSFRVTATGFPLPTLAATGLPGWLTLTKNGNGSATIAGTPTKGGVYNVTITATNTAGKTPQAFTLTVT